MTAKQTGNTFRAIELELLKDAPPDYVGYTARLFDIVRSHKEDHYNYYRSRRQEYDDVHAYRGYLIKLGVLGVVLTAGAAAARLSTAAHLVEAGSRWASLDLWLLIGALLAYAAMAGISFYVQNSDKAGGYFRAVLASFLVRDAWTDFQFQAERSRQEGPPADAAAEKAMRGKWLESAESFCKTIDAAALKEATEWRGAYDAGLETLYKAARDGVTQSKSELEGTVEALKKLADATRAAAKTASLNVEGRLRQAGRGGRHGGRSARGAGRAPRLRHHQPSARRPRGEGRGHGGGRQNVDGGKGGRARRRDSDPQAQTGSVTPSGRIGWRCDALAPRNGKAAAGGASADVESADWAKTR